MVVKMKKIQISVGSVAQALDRFEHVWRQAEKSTVPAAQLRLSFESLPTLLKNLTPARWTLLELLKRDGPLSINELASRLTRHYKNVHTDVTRLLEPSRDVTLSTLQRAAALVGRKVQIELV